MSYVSLWHTPVQFILNEFGVDATRLSSRFREKPFTIYRLMFMLRQMRRLTHPPPLTFANIE